MGVLAKVQSPDLRTVMIEAYRSAWAMFGEGALSNAVLSEIENIAYELVPLQGANWEENLPSTDLSVFLPVPAGTETALLPVPGFRTGLELFLAWVYREFARTNFSEGSTFQFSEGMITLRDWYEGAHPRLADFTLDTAMVAATNWHARFIGARQYRQPILPAWEVLRFPDGAHIDRLWTRRQFADEGTSMGHCVGGELDEAGVAHGDGRYFRGHRDGALAIFSCRDSAEVPQATVEVSLAPQRIAQVQGPEDGDIEDPFVRDRLLQFLSAVVPSTLQQVQPTWSTGEALDIRTVVPERMEQVLSKNVEVTYAARLLQERLAARARSPGEVSILGLLTLLFSGAHVWAQATAFGSGPGFVAVFEDQRTAGYPGFVGDASWSLRTPRGSGSLTLLVTDTGELQWWPVNRGVALARARGQFRTDGTSVGPLFTPSATPFAALVEGGFVETETHWKERTKLPEGVRWFPGQDIREENAPSVAMLPAPQVPTGLLPK